jgi:flagellar FliL protein
LVNVSGTMGTRYLLAEFILVGNSPNLKDQVLKSDAELRDAAASALASKTIADLEKPGIRNLVRGELITIFNSILGKNTVSEIYLTEFAIQ